MLLALCFFPSGRVEVLQRQISTGTLRHSINSEERHALEVFDQIYEEHISDDDQTRHQRASDRKLSGTHARRHISLPRHKRHEYENTLFNVLGPGFQEGTTSFARSDSGTQNDALSITEPFREKDGNFYFTGSSENRVKRESRNSELDRNKSGATMRIYESVSNDDNFPDRTMKRDYDNQQQENLVTTVTEQNDNGSITSYTIRSNVTTDNQLYHSTVIISQNSEIPPCLPSFSSHPSYNNTRTMITASGNDTEDQWDTLYNTAASHRSHVSNIDDYIDDSEYSVEQEIVLTNRNHDPVPEYAQVQKVDMRIHRLQNEEDFSKTPSWLHKEFVNTAYISD